MVDGVERELDVVVATADHAAAPAVRRVLAIGEAKSGETVGGERLRSLEGVRTSLGERAAGARLLLVAPRFTRDLQREAARRADLELVDLERLYEGD